MVVLSTCGGVPAAPASDPQPLAKTITILIREGRLYVTPHTEYAQAGESITWETALQPNPNQPEQAVGNLPYTLSFVGQSPMEKREFRYTAPSGGNGQTVAPVRSGATAPAPGSYKYTVAIFYKGEVLILDPEIIIDE